MHTHVGSSQTINSRSFLPMAFLLVIHPSSMCRVIRTVISGSPSLFVFLCSSANPVGAGKVNRWTIGTNRTVDAENIFLGEQRQKKSSGNLENYIAHLFFSKIERAPKLNVFKSPRKKKCFIIFRVRLFVSGQTCYANPL